MTNKLLNIAGCTLMVLAALAPLVAGHPNNGIALPQPIANPCGIEVIASEGGLPSVETYPVGIENGAVATQIAECAPYVNGAGIILDGATFASTAVVNTIIPDGINFSTAGAFCDMEVAGSGGGGDPQDETKVDASAPAGNMAPDSTWDDGGHGGACHVTTYDFAGYNTAGCSGTARAEDSLSGESVGILVGCDLLADVTPATDGNANAILVFALCVVNDVVLQGDPQPPLTGSLYTGLAGCLNTLLGDGCAINFAAAATTVPACLVGVVTTEVGQIVTCLTNSPPDCVVIAGCPNVVPTVVTCIVGSITPLGCAIGVGLPACLPGAIVRTLYCLLDATPDATTCGFVPAETQCGQDSFTDQFVFGEGGGRVASAGGSDNDNGVAFPNVAHDFPDGDLCAATGGSAVVYTMADVHVTLGSDEGSPADISVSLPTVGWIDTV
jgi:hypothetical protein